MTTQQGLRQTSFRAIGGTASTYNEDARAAFEAEATVPATATWNEAFMLWLQSRLSTSHDNLLDLMQEFATANGAFNWSSLGPFEAGAPGGVTAGLNFWTRADQSLSFDDEDAIGTWFGKSPATGNDSSQGTGAAKPRLVAPINSDSQLAVRFDGVDDFMSVDTPFSLAAGCTMLVVYHIWTRAPDFGGILSFGDGGTSDDEDAFFVFQMDTAASGDNRIFRDAVNPLTVAGTDIERIDFALVTIEGAADPAQDGEFRNNAGDFSDDFTATTFGTPGDIIKGARTKAASTIAEFLEVDLYEVAIWDRDLTVAERDAVELYAETRYAVSTETVPARPLLDTGGAVLLDEGGGASFAHLDS